MNQDLRYIRKLTKFMKKEGVLSLKTPDLELQLAPSALFPVEHAPEQTPEQALVEERVLTDEEILLWSAPGLNEESA